LSPPRIHDRRPRNEAKSDQSSLEMHNIYVAGNRTTVRLEPVIWDTLQSIARQNGIGLHDLVSEIDRQRYTKNLSSAIRAYVVMHLLTRLSENLSSRVVSLPRIGGHLC